MDMIKSSRLDLFTHKIREGTALLSWLQKEINTYKIKPSITNNIKLWSTIKTKREAKKHSNNTIKTAPSFEPTSYLPNILNINCTNSLRLLLFIREGFSQDVHMANRARSVHICPSDNNSGLHPVRETLNLLTVSGHAAFLFHIQSQQRQFTNHSLPHHTVSTPMSSSTVQVSCRAVWELQHGPHIDGRTDGVYSHANGTIRHTHNHNANMLIRCRFNIYHHHVTISV